MNTVGTDRADEATVSDIDLFVVSKYLISAENTRLLSELKICHLSSLNSNEFTVRISQFSTFFSPVSKKDAVLAFFQVSRDLLWSTWIFID